MSKFILWIEDDYYAIKGLFKPLEKEGFKVNVATSALDAYNQLQNWRTYDLIVVDLIVPLSDDDAKIPPQVKFWEDEQYVGLGIAKWLARDLKVERPVLLLSVVRDPIANFNLSEFGLKYYLSKSGLLPSRVKEKVLRILAGQD